MSSRSKGREQIIQILYLMEQSKLSHVEALAFFQNNFETYDREVPFVRSRIEGIVNELTPIDDRISSTSKHWKMYRIPKIDLSILRLGVYELLYCADVPLSVVIDEAVELSKKFGEENTPKFVNGILDQIAKTRP